MQRYLYHLSAAVSLLCLTGASLPDTPESGGAPASARWPTASRIAFASNRDGNWEIYMMSADYGTRAIRLTNRPEQDRFPLWSPDGKQIAFGSQVGNVWELWVMNDDGTNARRLFAGMMAKGAREWSPDGTRIVFESAPRGAREIHVVRVGDGAVVRLTADGADAHDPTWSRDGTHIVYTAGRDSASAIYTMRADGGAQTRLASAIGWAGSPRMSPDGSSIAFSSSLSGHAKELYRMHADGSHLEQLTTGASATNDPLHWAPDGSRIAFQSSRSDYDIEVVDLGTRARSAISPTAQYDGQAAWSADGRRLAFVSSRDGANALYVVNADGSGLRCLTSESTLDPRWSP